MALFTIPRETKENIYTKKAEIPQYQPSEIAPHIGSLCNIEKYSKLMRDINNASISDEEKQFLRLAASRHIVFNYSKIADYYAHASEEMQNLMEDSALVILDVDDAIAKGYIKLSKDIENIMSTSGEKTNAK